MHCRTCGYTLWNLPQPRCPECGTGFDLREYAFKAGAVAFGCPYCGALHEGAGPNYLPSEGDTATCRSCGQEMSVPAMRVVLLSDDPDSATLNAVPWQDRKRLGWWKAWLATCQLGMSNPSTLARRLQPSASWGEAYAFVAVTYALSLLAQFAVVLVVWIAVLLVSLLAGAETDVIEMVGFVGGMVTAMIGCGAVFGGLVTPLLLTAFMAGPAHLFLLVTGTTRHSFNATALCTLYAQGPMILMAIPICGYYLNNIWMIWTLVVAILLTKQVQAVSGLRATFAYLWLPILVFMLYIGAIIIAAATGMLEP